MCKENKMENDGKKQDLVEKSELKTPDKASSKRKVTPDHAPKDKKKVRTLFMGQDMETLFAEAEAKKDTCFIYIPSYARDEVVNEKASLVETDEDKAK